MNFNLRSTQEFSNKHIDISFDLESSGTSSSLFSSPFPLIIFIHVSASARIHANLTTVACPTAVRRSNCSFHLAGDKDFVEIFSSTGASRFRSNDGEQRDCNNDKNMGRGEGSSNYNTGRRRNN